MRRATLIRLAGAALLSLAAYGSTHGDPTLCRAIAEDAARLACYDKLPDRPPGSATVVPMAPPAAEVAPSSETLFGRDTVESEDMVRRAAGIGRLDEITVRVSGVKKDPLGKLVLTLDNGQVWVQIDSATSRIESGDVVRIRRAALGSYLLAGADGKRSIRVRRKQ